MLQTSEDYVFVSNRLLPNLFVFLSVEFLYFFKDRIKRRADFIVNFLMHFFEERKIDNLIDFIKFLNTIDQKIAIFDIFLFEELPSLFDGVAVDKRIAWLYLKFMLELIIVGIVI